MNALLLCPGVVIILAIALGLIALIRYLNYRETITLAEQGLSRPETKNSKPFLRWGLMISVLGLALTLGLYAIGFDEGYNYPLHLGPWVLGGLIPLFLGLGLVLFHYLTEKE